MSSRKCRVVIPVLFILIGHSIVIAQPSTLSVEVVAKNGVSVNPSTSGITAEPGDKLTVVVFARDWSGSVVKGYQVVFDPAGYTSGSAGNVFPKDFAITTDLNGLCTAGGTEGTDNLTYSFIDKNRADYIFAGQGSGLFTALDSFKCGYRYIATVLGPGVNSNPGEKKSLATVILDVSADATGTFTIGLNQTPVSGSRLAPQAGQSISPLTVETLSINVPDAVAIVSSLPPNNAIDAGQPTSLDGMSRFGWNLVILTFDGDASGVQTGDFEVTEDPPGTPPMVTDVFHNGNQAQVQLSSPITPGKWTTLTHVPSGTSTRLGFLPADTNGDRTSGPLDILTIIDYLNGVVVLDIWQTDADRSGEANAQDILRVIDLLNGASEFEVWNGRSLP